MQSSSDNVASVNMASDNMTSDYMASDSLHVTSDNMASDTMTQIGLKMKQICVKENLSGLGETCKHPQRLGWRSQFTSAWLKRSLLGRLNHYQKRLPDLCLKFVRMIRKLFPSPRDAFGIQLTFIRVTNSDKQGTLGNKHLKYLEERDDHFRVDALLLSEFVQTPWVPPWTPRLI
ncbi:hypothetical protein TNCV_2916071 [Trichonephila clavipes]|nr:hypothetical protein TNCV_2916071 [Trichonephila clavipes]